MTVQIPSSKTFHQNFFTLRYDWVTRYNCQRFLNTNLPNKTWNHFTSGEKSYTPIYPRKMKVAM